MTRRIDIHQDVQLQVHYIDVLGLFINLLIKKMSPLFTCKQWIVQKYIKG